MKEKRIIRATISVAMTLFMSLYDLLFLHPYLEELVMKNPGPNPAIAPEAPEHA